MQAHLIYWRYVYPEASPLLGAVNRKRLWGIPADRREPHRYRWQQPAG